MTYPRAGGFRIVLGAGGRRFKSYRPDQSFPLFEVRVQRCISSVDRSGQYSTCHYLGLEVGSRRPRNAGSVLNRLGKLAS